MFEDIKKNIQRKTEEFEKQLVEQAVHTAGEYYSNAIYAGDNDVTVHRNGNEVYADGNAALFIEFGTGVLRMSPPSDVYQSLESTDGLVSHGRYGQGRASSIKGWIYKEKPVMRGVQPADDEESYLKKGFRHTWGNDATPAMYFARKEVIERAETIGKKVFK